jgi:hypothetical protein
VKPGTVKSKDTVYIHKQTILLNNPPSMLILREMMFTYLSMKIWMLFQNHMSRLYQQLVILDPKLLRANHRPNVPESKTMRM